MLSTKKRTSSFCAWRCSASVMPVNTTSNRAPGGSFIWPKTRLTLSRSPVCSSSWYSSFPSRIRSPTPVKMHAPCCRSTTLGMSSRGRTLLPNAAPPSIPGDIVGGGEGDTLGDVVPHVLLDLEDDPLPVVRVGFDDLVDGGKSTRRLELHLHDGPLNGHDLSDLAHRGGSTASRRRATTPAYVSRMLVSVTSCRPRKYCKVCFFFAWASSRKLASRCMARAPNSASRLCQKTS